MKNTTLCYITRGDQVLMLHRVKKKNDINHDKWIGIGGKFEGEESPDECLLRGQPQLYQIHMQPRSIPKKQNCISPAVFLYMILYFQFSPL